MNSPRSPSEAPYAVVETTESAEATGQSLPSIGNLVSSAVDGEFSRGIPQRTKERDLRPVNNFDGIEIDDDTEIYLDGILLKTYRLDGLPFTMTQHANETQVVHSRRTVGGRDLTYQLSVVQQPVRARACGSGPRSSADRRPVDPPPVVELHVFEGRGEHSVDITIGYDATFLLYASLEVARPIANGRLFTGPITPVLTGVPVAGTAYLDKPNKAGYFIFPDLSVRHEGWYNLKFDLFEAVKHPEDAHPGQSNEPGPEPRDGKPIGPHERLVNLTYVRSEKFQVFSAKKFPGLNQSTEMSRCIAEQGCRVRIRREVRQRKRVTTKRDVGQHDDDEEDSRPSHAVSEIHSRTSTPSDHMRSMSRNSHEGSHFGADHYRHISSDSTYHSQHLPAMSLPPSPRETAPAPAATPPTLNSVSHPYIAPQPPRQLASSPIMLPPLHIPSGPAPAGPTLTYQHSLENMRDPRESFTRRTNYPMMSSSNSMPPHSATSEQSDIIPSMMNGRRLPPPANFASNTSSLDTGRSGLDSSRPSFDSSIRATLEANKRVVDPEPRRRWYNIESSGPQKRTANPQTYSHSAALKSGARPDTLPSPQPRASMTLPAPGHSNWSQPQITPDSGEGEDETDSEDSFNEHGYTYMRADGSYGNKVDMHIRRSTPRASRWPVWPGGARGSGSESKREGQ